SFAASATHGHARRPTDGRRGVLTPRRRTDIHEVPQPAPPGATAGSCNERNRHRTRGHPFDGRSPRNDRPGMPATRIRGARARLGASPSRRPGAGARGGRSLWPGRPGDLRRRHPQRHLRPRRAPGIGEGTTAEACRLPLHGLGGRLRGRLPRRPVPVGRGARRTARRQAGADPGHRRPHRRQRGLGRGHQRPLPAALHRPPRAPAEPLAARPSPPPPPAPGIADNVDRVEAILADDGSPPLRWLREHGRYITPRGGGDVLYAAAVYLRNLLSLHYVFAVTVLTVLLAGNLLRAFAWERLPGLRAFEAWLFHAQAGPWWSPWFALPVAGLLLVLVPLG